MNAVLKLAEPNIGDILDSEIRYCDLHGDYKSTKHVYFTRPIWTKCQKCLAHEEREKLAQKEKEKLEDIYKAKVKRFEQSRLMRRYWDLKLDDIQPTSQQKDAHKFSCAFVERFAEMEKKGQTLIFCGGVGTGKTMMAHAIIQTLGVGLYIHAVDISREVRAGYSSGKNEIEIINYFVEQKLLVIDEVGVQQGTENETMLITDLIDRRYGDLRPTIICTNLDKAGLEENLGSRAWDRLMQNGVIVPVLGESQRK